MIRPSHIIWGVPGFILGASGGDTGLIWAAIGLACLGMWAAIWENNNA